MKHRLSLFLLILGMIGAYTHVHAQEILVGN